MRKAKMIFTVGPSCSEPAILHKLMLAGMDAARLNFSHGTASQHRQMYGRLRSLARRLRKPLAILQDIQGPRVRLGRLAGERVQIRSGASFILTTRSITGDSLRASVQYNQLHREVNKGDRILLADGSIQLRVVEVDGRDILTRVLSGGELNSHQGLNLPGVDISAPAVTDKDRKDLRLGVRLGVDMVAVSFVRRPEDVIQVKRIIKKAGGDAEVVAKIEHPQALEHLDDILDACDGIMVARGDLGVEMPPERVPAIQKSLITRANQRGKLAIVATQMLESMRRNPRPTRAEASDVANAVFDGADALMLSGETANGEYPVEAAQMMARIITEAEKSPALMNPTSNRPLQDPALFPNAVCNAAVVAARDIDARLIVAFTESGSTARLLSDYRPQARIVALTPHLRTYNRLNVLWGVEPIKVPKVRSTDAMLRQVNQTLLQLGYARPGDGVVIASGVPIGQPGSTNLLKLHRVA